jgi:hypothetical protein
MNNTTSFLHNGSIGDVHASLPVMKEYYRKFKKKVILYLQKDVKAFYYEGATHPTMDKDGNMTMLNQQVIDMMIPLYKAQEYIEDCKVYNDEKIHCNLGRIRDTFVNMPHGDLRMWYPIIYPDLVCNFAVPYITVPDLTEDIARGKLIVARSERYHSPQASYYFLKKYEDKLLFVGTDLEYAIFTIRYKLNIPRLIINNFLELAQILKQSLGLLSNQTQIFQIAEGLKIPRIVELCSFAPNVIPMGKDGYYFYSQDALVHYVKELLGETEKTQLSGFVPPEIDFNNLSVH